MTSTNDCNRNVSHSSNDCELLVNVHVVFFFFFNFVVHLYVVHCVFLVMFFFKFWELALVAPSAHSMVLPGLVA